MVNIGNNVDCAPKRNIGKKELDIERNEVITFLKQMSRNIVDIGHASKESERE